jgi:Reverse transcriptase (RNA-dependent DNA polymerase)
MSRSAITRALLSNGYFPKELPPVFTTVDFGKNSEAIIADWENLGIFRVKPAKKFNNIGGKKFRGRFSYEGVPQAEPEILSKPKKLYERRNVHITHPVPQALLAREVANNWVHIQKWLSKQNFSEDEIVVGDQYERAIKGINFAVHRAKTGYLEATSDWLVKTDITRFYPSIYTHSIAWAAYGKEKVKSSLKVYEGTLADRLDLLVRSCNRNQTVGIPIGPETSRIIAEIISSRIDFDFASALPEIPQQNIDRLQDDWTVGSQTLEGAENIISVISKCYRDYGLEINGSKTSVTHLLSSKQASWQSEISAFLSHRRDGLDGTRLREFLALCLRLQLGHPSEAVLNYALSIVEGLRILRKDLEIVESFLLKVAAISPISMDRVCRIILNIEHSIGGLSKERITNRFVSLAEKYFENGSLYEVIWLLYAIRGMKKPFHSKKIMLLSENVQSSALRLLLLDMKQMGLCVKSPPSAKWASDIKEDRILADWSWLFAYEAIRKGWLPDPAGLISKPFFKPMHDRDVIFYDPKRNVLRSSFVKKSSFFEMKRQSHEVQLLMRWLRGTDDRFGSGSSDY